MTSESKSYINAIKTWWKCLTVTSLEIVNENKSVSGYHLGYLLNNPDFIEKLHTDVQAILHLWEQKKIKVHIDSTHGFSKVGEAFKRMHSHKNVGKILIKPDCEMPPPPPEEATATTSAEEAPKDKDTTITTGTLTKDKAASPKSPKSKEKPAESKKEKEKEKEKEKGKEKEKEKQEAPVETPVKEKEAKDTE